MNEDEDGEVIGQEDAEEEVVTNDNDSDTMLDGTQLDEDNCLEENEEEDDEQWQILAQFENEDELS